MADGTASTSLGSSPPLIFLQLRTCVWNLINLELFQSLFAGGKHASNPIDSALESVLLSFANSSATQHPHVQFLHTYSHSSERTEEHRQCVDQLQSYGLDLALLTTTPSVSEQEDGVNSPLYNCELLTKVLQLDVDVAFELEATRMDQSLASTNTIRMDADESTALVLRESRVDGASQRQRVEQLILSLRNVNDSILLSDAELSLLKSWRTFVQICLQRQPSLLGIKPKSDLSWQLIVDTANVMAETERTDDGHVCMTLMQNLSSLLLAFVSGGLLESSSTEASTPLSAAMLIYLSREQQRSTHPRLEVDETASGESIFRSTNQLLASIAVTLQSALQKYTSAAGKQSIVTNVIARPFSFDATARITTGWYANRISPISNSSVISPTSALVHVQNLSSTSLLLTRWANQLLMNQLHLPLSNAISTPVMVGQSHPPLRSSPVQRPTFGSPVRAPASALKPVLEAQKSLSNRALISAIGDEYASTCHSLMQAAAVCLSHSQLADTAVNVVPLLLQAIDIVQGAAEQRSENVAFVQHEEDPMDAAIELMRPVLPTLLQQFMHIPLSQPSHAHKLAQLLCVIAQYERGADMLVQQSIILCLSRHPIFNPTVTPPLAPNSTGETVHHASFSPYTPQQTRDEWHQVWLLCLNLITTLLRSTTTRASLSGLAGVQSLPTPTQTRLIEEVLGFFNMFSGRRFNKVLHLSHVSRLSIGSLEEIEAVTHLLYEFEKYGRIWHNANPSLHFTQKQQVLLVVTYYMRLLNDPRELEKRILIVTADEKADAVEPVDTEVTAVAEDLTAPSTTDFAHALTRHASTSGDDISRPLATLERQKSESSVAVAEKRTWRALGAASGLNSGSSTPRQLSTPTTPRSVSTPSTHATPGEDKLKGAAPLMLTPTRGTSSFLLRSPVVAPLLQEPNIGTGFISGANLADTKHMLAQPQRGMAFFTQRIEFSMALILRNCFSYLRLVSETHRPSIRDALLSHRIKVVNIGTSAHGLIHGVSDMDSTNNNSTFFGGAMWTLANEMHSGAPNTMHVGLTSREKMQQLLSGLGVGIEEEAQRTQADIDFESDYYEIADGIEPSQKRFYRPPLSNLIDFQQYLVRVLSRLYEIQRSSGMLDTLTAETERESVAEDRSVATPRLPNSAELLRGSASALSATAPSIPTIHRLMHYLLENSLLLLVQHVQLHANRLKQVQRHYLAQVQPQQQGLPPYTGDAMQSPPIPVHAGAIRVGKLLESFRERVMQLTDLLLRYLNLLSSSDAAPPSLRDDRTVQVHASALVVQLVDQLEEEGIALTRYNNAFHKHVQSMQAQQQQLLQQQQQQQQYY
jgi:hypothetical protein